MKKKKNIFKMIFVLLIITLILISVAYLLNARYHVFKGHTLSGEAHPGHAGKAVYYCPMHPGFTSDKPGDCAICGMKLVKKEEAQAIEKKAKTPEEICILHNCKMTNCPMQITGDIKDCPFCGAHLTKGSEESGIFISSERQQLIGVKKEKVEKRKLNHQILTVGRVAYDPALFVAQEEYLQALNAKEKTSESALPLIKKQTESLVEAAKRKLMLLGMNEQEIDGLAKRGKPQENLYLPLTGDTVWVYMTIYEYEIGLIKEGLPIEVDAVAFPGEIFKGKIIAITPVLDPMTRSIQVRAEIDNPEHKLKPDMFVNVKINIDLGEKLAVSNEAVINTGKRTIVVVTNEKGNFFSREVKLGQKAEGFYEVLEGLAEGETVVTSGNFLIDSESRLQSAVTEEHKHGQ